MTGTNRRWFATFVLAMAAFPTGASAQGVPAQPGGKVSVVGAVEYAFVTEDDGYLGAGIGGAGGLQFHLTNATSIEIEIARVRHIRDLGLFAVAFDAQGRPQALPVTVRWEGTATYVLGLVSRTFGSARARPVVWAGGGLMSHGGTLARPLAALEVPPGLTLQQVPAAARRGSSSRAFAMDGGVGVDVRVTGRFTIRPFAGLRVATTDNVGPKYIVRGGARIGFRW